MTVNKRLLFASLALATAIVAAVAVGTASHNNSDASTDDITLSSSGDLAPTIGTNAALTGRSVPTTQLQTVNGDPFPSADLVGRPLVINMWYSTCAPCKRELPAFAAAQAKFGDQVRFVGINPSGLDSTTEDRFARDKGVQYELFYDPDGEFTTALGIATFPQTLFVEPSGEILVQSGELTATKLEDLIRTKLL